VKAVNKKFKRAIVLKGGGIVMPYIADDCVAALDQVGVIVFGLSIRVLSGQTFDSVRDETREKLNEIKPDFILSMDAGLVRDEPAFFEDLGIPVVAWFVDDPTIDMTPEKMFDKLMIFSWDREYIQILRDYGCKVVEYLPLGTNPAKFRRTPPTDPRCAPFACDVSFVGSSLEKQSIRSIIDNEYEPKLREVMNECIRQHAEPPHTPVSELLNEALGREKLALVADNRRAFEGQIEIEAMMLYRSRALNRLARFAPHVYGDDGWPALLDPGSVFRGPIVYDVDLPLLYSASRINLNLTKSQLKTSVNQRVFDAPACGGFVLTDKREDAELLFDTDKEIAVFNSYDDMEAKTAYFLENSEERETRARMTKRHVLAEHTYAHRMRRILEVIGDYI